METTRRVEKHSPQVVVVATGIATMEGQQVVSPINLLWVVDSATQEMIRAIKAQEIKQDQVVLV